MFNGLLYNERNRFNSRQSMTGGVKNAIIDELAANEEPLTC